MHQQILGSGSPTSWSITRLPPNAVSTSTMPGGSVLTSPISAASSPPGARAQRGERRVGRLGRDEGDELALVGDVHRVDAEQLRRARDRRVDRARRPRARRIATPEARASSLSTEATPPRVASRRQRSSGPAASSSASTAGHSERVSDSIVAPSSNSPRASMIAVPWSPTRPESRIRSPGRSAGGREPRALVDQPEPGRADVHAVGVAALDDLGVAGDDRARPPPRPARAIASTSARSVLGGQALLEDQRQRQRERARAGHREVVDRAVDGELADRAAGEAQRLDDEGVGGQRERRRSDGRRRRPRRRARRCRTRAASSPSISALRRLAAGAVGHRDRARRGTSPASRGRSR